MTPAQLREARQSLGLSQAQLGVLLGYEPDTSRQMVSHLERGRRTLRDAQLRLLTAYCEGYRPRDWP